MIIITVLPENYSLHLSSSEKIIDLKLLHCMKLDHSQHCRYCVVYAHENQFFGDLFKSFYVYSAPKSDVKSRLTYRFNDFDVSIHILYPHNCITPPYIFHSYGFYFDSDFAYK